LCKQVRSKDSFQLFFFNETAEQTASIFLRLPMNDHPKG
jgi:hypothetical protein